VQVSIEGLGGAAKISGKCQLCGERLSFVTSPFMEETGGQPSRTEIGTKIALGSFLSGSTVSDTTRFLDIAGIGHYSSKVFHKINRQIRPVVQAETDKILEEELTKVTKNDNKLNMKLDFTWNCRNKGKMGTLTCISMDTNKSIFRVHKQSVGREKNHDVPSFPFLSSSSSSSSSTSSLFIYNLFGLKDYCEWVFLTTKTNQKHHVGRSQSNGGKGC